MTTSGPSPAALARVGRSRRYAWPLAAVLLLVSVMSMVYWLSQPRTPVWNGGEIVPAARLPVLALQRSTGEPFAMAPRGRISFFFFGYTTCPDVCPMTMAQMAQVRHLLGDRAKDVDIYFITVDPERDTPERLTAYARAFGPGIVALTGTQEQLAAAREVFGAAAVRREVPDSAVGYLMDHSASIYLVDQENRLRLVYGPGSTPAEIVADVQYLLR